MVLWNIFQPGLPHNTPTQKPRHDRLLIQDPTNGNVHHLNKFSEDLLVSSSVVLRPRWEKMQSHRHDPDVQSGVQPTLPPVPFLGNGNPWRWACDRKGDSAVRISVCGRPQPSSQVLDGL